MSTFLLVAELLARFLYFFAGVGSCIEVNRKPRHTAGVVLMYVILGLAILLDVIGGAR